MENELLFQLGINWKLFLSQVVNFFILLLVLTFFVYKPLIRIIKERSKKIKEGLEKAEKKQKDAQELLKLSILKQKEEAREIVLKDAVELVKKIVSKTVELNPKDIDDKLVKKAVSELNEI